MKIKAIVSYNGKRYQGWQKQDNTLTVQGVIEETLSTYLNSETKIYGSGRTDTGVHAFGQVFHFETLKDIDIDQMRYSLNRMLPDDIHIKSLEVVDNSFHARFSLKDKTYEYRISFKEKDPLERDNVYVCPFPTDIDTFKKCLLLFKGKHDFRNFTSKEEDEDNFIRDIYDISFSDEEDTLVITFKGNGFMRYMIRFIVGVSLAIAQGKENEAYINKYLDNKDERHIVSYKAIASGLTLKKVTY